MLVNIYLNRDSVCMADDMEDHARMISVDMHGNLQNELLRIAKHYLPNVAGVGHRWICKLNKETIATVYGNSLRITMNTKNLFEIPDNSKISFCYVSATY